MAQRRICVAEDQCWRLVQTKRRLVLVFTNRSIISKIPLCRRLQPKDQQWGKWDCSYTKREQGSDERAHPDSPAPFPAWRKSRKAIESCCKPRARHDHRFKFPHLLSLLGVQFLSRRSSPGVNRSSMRPVGESTALRHTSTH